MTSYDALLIFWWPLDFLENSKIIQNQQEIDQKH